jgi:hypothetical protein
VAPKTSILAIGGSLKNSQDDIMSANFFGDFERSFADLIAMYWVAMRPILAASAELFLKRKIRGPELMKGG